MQKIGRISPKMVLRRLVESPVRKFDQMEYHSPIIRGIVS